MSDTDINIQILWLM